MGAGLLRFTVIFSAAATLAGVWMGIGQVQATDVPISGQLYFTRYCEANNVNKVSFTYNGTSVTYGTQTNIVQANGADGIIFAPDGDLLVGGQGTGLVHKINPTTAATVEANSNTGAAFHLALDPGKSNVYAMGLPGSASQIALASFGSFPGGTPSSNRR